VIESTCRRPRRRLSSSRGLASVVISLDARLAICVMLGTRWGDRWAHLQGRARQSVEAPRLPATRRMMELTPDLRRRKVLVAALAALRVKSWSSWPELQMMHQWLDGWTGLGLIATGMERQGYRLHLTNAEPGTWRATFSTHPMTSAEGFGAAPTPGAVQEAAWEAVNAPSKPEPSVPSANVILR